ncbi:polysaccharide lyase [Oligoflexus tunisiensis]|uniref:polysaccharide lyase n=1 Tax=Oligoflexus tunisiensis TaxID=708132 RepID=UPI00114C8B30|nr:hypothetical protein [Oligoflexus tunisiensis]
MLLKSRMLSYGLFIVLGVGACHEPDAKSPGNGRSSEPIADQESGNLQNDGAREVTLVPEMSQPGLYTFDNFPDGWNIEKIGRLKEGIANERVLHDPMGVRSGKVLEVLYPKGTASPSYSKSVGLKPGGTQFVVDTGHPADGIKLSYWYRFGEGFDCVKGGKLPGVASTGELISGGETPTGTNGFSVRLMWRENCKGEVYAYFSQAGNEHLANDPQAQLEKNSTTGKVYGWSLGRGTFSFPQGRWAFVEIEVKANRVGQNDGMVRVAIDAQEVYKRSDFSMRTTDQLKLSRLFFSTFFGGSSPGSATRKDERVYFADLQLTAMEDRPVPVGDSEIEWTCVDCRP